MTKNAGKEMNRVQISITHISYTMAFLFFCTSASLDILCHVGLMAFVLVIFEVAAVVANICGASMAGFVVLLLLLTMDRFKFVDNVDVVVPLIFSLEFKFVGVAVELPLSTGLSICGFCCWSSSNIVAGEEAASIVSFSSGAEVIFDVLLLFSCCSSFKNDAKSSFSSSC